MIQNRIIQLKYCIFRRIFFIKYCIYLRVDKTFYLDNCNPSQAKEMFTHFFEDVDKNQLDVVQNFFDSLSKKTPVSPAAFESYLSQFKENAQTAVENINVLEEMIESEYKLRHEGKTVIYHYSSCDRKWIISGKPRAKRPWDSIVTQGNIKQCLLDDVQRFQEDETWYHEHGIPYRCGFLLHGPPGTGKSSLAFGLAGKLDYGICILSFTDKNMTDSDLMRQLSSIPTKCLVLIEDIDVALPSTKRKHDIIASKDRNDNVVQPNVTLSGVLNAIDGVESADSQIIIMTTNFKEHLDPALIRPGR